MTTIVANTFDRIVNDPTKEVLVFYFVEWCAHAVSLEGTWADLAYDVKEIEDLVIGKLDYIENEVIGLDIRTYPTIKFYPKGNKTGIVYEAEKTLDDFKNWLYEHSPAYKNANPNHNEESA